MTLTALKEFLGEEKAKLFKAVEYISTFYRQIASSLEALRDNLIPYSFSPRSSWKESLDKHATQITVPELRPQNVFGDPDFNANTLITIINNILAVQNTFLADPGGVQVPDIKLIRKMHQFLISFMDEQFSNANISSLKKQQRDLAFSVKQTIEKRLRDNIDPFFARLEIILDDEYRVGLAGHVSLIVESLANYKKNPDLYDELIARKCQELGLRNNPEQNLVVIADMEKPEALIAAEIRAKYEFTGEKTAPSIHYRLKEIAQRYVSQAENLGSLILFLREAERSLLHISLLRRIALFIKSVLTGRNREITQNNIVFSYVTSRGKIERRQASLNDLLNDASFYYKYLLKFKEDLELDYYAKTPTPQMTAQLEKFVDTSFVSLADILEKCHGFRDWLGRENNLRLLKRIPEKRQEDLNDFLLHINRTCIINTYNLQEMQKRKER